MQKKARKEKKEENRLSFTPVFQIGQKGKGLTVKVSFILGNNCPMSAGIKGNKGGRKRLNCLANKEPVLIHHGKQFPVLQPNSIKNFLTKPALWIRLVWGCGLSTTIILTSPPHLLCCLHKIAQHSQSNKHKPSYSRLNYIFIPIRLGARYKRKYKAKARSGTEY